MATQPQQDWLDTDFYAALGVSANASDADIKKAYKRLARELHPDANPNNPTAEERFKAVSRAKEVVGDPETRKAYDDYRALVRSAGPRPAGSSFTFSGDDLGGFDLSDLLGGFFAPGTGRPRSARPGQWGPRPGADVRAHLTMEFLDAVNGIETTLTIGDRQIKTRIPAGVEDGQTIRLAGKGKPPEPGAGGPPGDLLLEISVAPHPRFGRKGRDVTVGASVTYTEAALGAEIEVPSPQGQTVRLKVPAGTQPGQTLRAKGKGGPRSDLLVTVTLAVPRHLDDDERQALEALAAVEARNRHRSP